MNLSKRIEALIYLAEILQLKEEELIATQQISKNKNSWFTLENSNRSLENIITNFECKPTIFIFTYLLGSN